jgi:hypothetical protein
MRKLQLKNYQASQRGRILDIVEMYTLRRDSYTYNKSSFMNDACENLNKFFMGKFVSPDENVVIIDDKRQEICRLNNRSLVTTGLLYEELLQVNRGKQNYEGDRNKFFTDDETGNASQFRHANYIYLLDLCWYMHEQQMDAVEIGKVGVPQLSFDELEDNFLSERYNNMLNSVQTTLFNKGVEVITEYGNKWFSVLNEVTSNNIEFEKGIHAYTSDPRVVEFMENDNVGKYDSEFHALERYWAYVNEQNSATPPAPVKPWEEYIIELAQEWAKDNRIQFDPSWLAVANGMSEPTDRTAVNYICASYTHIPWKLVKKSEFKRNDDWTLNSINFYKSEALKLRRILLEGTFDE